MPHFDGFCNRRISVVQLKCCGVNNYTDWRNSTQMADTDDVPDSCCIHKATNCGVNVRARDWTKANLTIYANVRLLPFTIII